MADELPETIQSVLEEALDQPLAAARRDLAERLGRELAAAREAAAAQAARAARSSALQALNLAVRRIRHASSITEIGAALLESAAGYCGRTAMLVHKGQSLAGWRASGFTSNGAAFAETWARFQVPVASAPALAQVIETRESAVSLSLPDHLSPALVELLGVPPEEKTYLFPLSVRQKVVALLYADAVGSTDGVQPAALELLCSVAEAAIEVLSTRPPTPSRAEKETASAQQFHLSITPPAYARPADWESLSPAEQDMHLRAQRFARVLVADLQLYRADAVREGKQARDLYGRLRDEIDKSREAYHRKFGQSVAADYFHVELLRTLAGDDEAVLGPDYPGPMTEPMFG